jgi:phenylalanyl-tRNA synthetase beta subunit
LKLSIRKISDILTAEGFYEVYNRSLVKEGKIYLANSLNANATALRANLLDSLKEKVEKNFQFSAEPKFFEIGKIFTGIEGNEVLEEFSFAGIIGRKKNKGKTKRRFILQN